MSGSDKRQTRSAADSTTPHLMLDDKNTPTAQMSNEQKVDDFIKKLDLEIKGKFKFTNYQSTEDQKDLYKKIENNRRIHKISRICGQQK